jgi:hypothetical protein
MYNRYSVSQLVMMPWFMATGARLLSWEHDGIVAAFLQAQPSPRPAAPRRLTRRSGAAGAAAGSCGAVQVLPPVRRAGVAAAHARVRTPALLLLKTRRTPHFSRQGAQAVCVNVMQSNRSVNLPTTSFGCTSSHHSPRVSSQRACSKRAAAAPPPPPHL